MRYGMYTSYITIKAMQEEYAKAIREHERQAKYERGIVRSVPAMEIVPLIKETPTTNRVEPG